MLRRVLIERLGEPKLRISFTIYGLSHAKSSLPCSLSEKIVKDLGAVSAFRKLPFVRGRECPFVDLLLHVALAN